MILPTRDERIAAVEKAARELTAANDALHVAACRRHSAERAFRDAAEGDDSLLPIAVDGHLFRWQPEPLCIARHVQVEPIRSAANMFPATDDE